MAGPARDAGWPDNSSTGSSKFIPQIWSGKLVQKFYSTTMFAECANTDYEGEIKGQGDTVIIRTVPDITVSNYTIGAGITYQKPTSPAVELSIDKAKFFAFECNDIEVHQSDLKKMEKWSDDASHKMRIAIDRDVLAYAYTEADAANAGDSAGAISGSYDLGTTGAPVAITKANVLDFLVDMGTVADEADWPDEDRWIALPAWMCGMIKQSDLQDASLSGDGKSILRTGAIGMIDRWKIYRNNQVATTVDGANTAFNLVAGHKAGLTFASQMTKMESLKNPDDFGDLVRGLNVHGYKVVDGKKIMHGYVRKG